MADPNQEKQSEELRELDRKFEEILKRCEKEPRKEGESTFPEWYRPPDSGIPSWLSQESPLAQQTQPDRLAAVIASFEWPSRGGGFSWSVCLPTSGNK